MEDFNFCNYLSLHKNAPVELSLLDSQSTTLESAKTSLSVTLELFFNNSSGFLKNYELNEENLKDLKHLSKFLNF